MPTRLMAHKRVSVLGIVLTVVGATMLGLAGDTGGRGGIAAAVLGLVVVFLLARLVARDEVWLAPVLALSYGIRIAAIGAITLGSNIVSRRPFLFGDEAGYAEFARFSYEALQRGADPVRVLAGHGVVGANPYVDVQTIGYLLFGPDLSLIRAVNALFGVLTGLIAFDLVRRLFSRHAAWVAAALLLALPSLFIWSIANLRESWIAFSLVVLVWWVERMRTRPQLGWLVLGLFDLALIQGLRTLLFYLVTVPFVISVLIGLRSLRRPIYIATAVTALVLGPGLLMERSEQGWFGVRLFQPSTITLIEQSRAFMALGARTAFGVAPRISADALVLPPGQVVRIEQPSATAPVTLATLTPMPTPAPTPTGPRATPSLPPTPTPTPPLASEPTTSPTPIVVQVGQQVILVTDPDVSPSPDPAKVFVRPGDLIVLEGPTRSIDPRPLVLSFGEQNYFEVQAQDPDRSLGASLRRIAGLVPTGFLYLALAPFPGLTQTGIELPGLIEVLPWAAALVAAGGTLVLERRRWLDLLPLASYAIALVVMLSIVEGNVGTLIRHRAMAIPLVVMLGAPTLLSWLAKTTSFVLAKRS